MKLFTSLSPEDQRKTYNEIIYDLKTTTFQDANKISHNLESMIVLSTCKVLRGMKFIDG